MSDHPDIEHLPVEGVHTLNDDSYRDYRRNSHVVLNCEKCGKKNSENGKNLKRCAGVRFLFFFVKTLVNRLFSALK